MKTKPEPIPCPHCNQGANSDVNDGKWTVACCACPAGQVKGFDTEEEAVAAWNRRVEDPALEELKKAANEYAKDDWRALRNAPKLAAMALLYARAHSEKGKR